MVRGSQVAARLAELRKEYAGSGRLPVALGDRDSLANLTDTMECNLEDSRQPSSVQYSAEEWFERHLAEDPEAYLSLEEDEFDPEGAAPMTSLQVGFDYKGKELPEVAIALVNAGASWDLPLALGYGGWNACPMPEEHALVAKYWFEKYGAEILVMTADTIEFAVARPPVDPAECARLAREMYIYCADTVDQGVGSVSTLAKCVEGSPYWFFWWD